MRKEEKKMDFKEMIKKWVEYDYCTPGIKSEVIIDMLISEFIEEIIRFGAADGKVKDNDIELITKEFPFACCQEENPNDRNFKADYLVANHEEKIMYVVELKTSKDSLSIKQLQNYTKILNPNNFAKYWDFQNKLINTYGKHKTEEPQAATKIYGSRKYRYTGSRLEKTRYKTEHLYKQKYTMRLQYILLDENCDRSLENVKESCEWINAPIVLKKLCGNSNFYSVLDDNKKELWEIVEDILKTLWNPKS
jgi:hypothetical protein